jgi:MFS family permease
MKSSRNLYLAAATACITAALFGYGVGFIGGVLVLPSFHRNFGLDTLKPHELLKAQGATVTSWLVGTLGGVAVGMPVYSRLGRKACLLFCAVLYTVGAIIQISGRGSIEVFDTGRFVNGIGVGAGTLVSPL